MEYCLGVDLGTTFVAAAVARDQRVEMVPLGDRSVVMPSAVYVRSDGQLVTGDAAARRAVSNPDRVASEIKRRLGDPTPCMLGGSAYPVTDLLGVLLREVLAKVHAEHGGPPAAVMLTHPATWGPYRRELFEEVPRSAGVEQWRMVTEPEAAAAHYAATREMAVGEVIAVYDFGGGTFDATVLGRTENGIEVLGTPEGIERLGGTDLDESILAFVNHAAGGALAELDLGDASTVVALARLRQDCVLAKEALSIDTETVIPVFIPGRHLDVPLSRSQFEGMIRAQLESTIGTLNRALRSAGVPPSRLSAVLLVGGSAQIPFVARMVEEQLGCPTIVDAHPKHPVALGAATVARFAGMLPAPDRGAGRASTPVDRPEPAAEQTAPVADRTAARGAVPTQRSEGADDIGADRRTASGPGTSADPGANPNGRPGTRREVVDLAAGAAAVTGATTGQAAPGPEAARVAGTPAAGDAGAAPLVAPGGPQDAPPADRGSGPPAGGLPGSLPPREGLPPGGPVPPDGGSSGPPVPPTPPDPSLIEGPPGPGAQPRRGRRLRRGTLIGALIAAASAVLIVVLIVVLAGPDRAADGRGGSSAPPSSPEASATGETAAPAPPAVTPAVPIPSLGTAVPVGSTPNYVATTPNGNQLYVANGDAGTITVVDTAVNSVTATIDVPAGPPQYLAFSPDGKRMYVSVWNEERTITVLCVVDTTRNAIIETIPMASRPYVPAVTPDGTRVYVPNHDTGNITVIDTSTNQKITDIDVPKNPHFVAFTPDGTRAYVANHESNLVSVLDVASNKVIATVPVGKSPHSLAVHPTRPLVANVNYDDASVTFIDTGTNQVVATVPVGTNPQYIAWSADGRFAYTVNNTANSVSVIDAETFTVTATVPTGASPTSMAVLPDGKTAYVSDEDAGTLTVLNVGS